MKLIWGASFFAGLAVFVTAVAALATPGTNVSTLLASGTMEPIHIDVKTEDWKLQLKTKEASNLSVAENRVAPGGDFGWHSHPGPSLVIVKSGTSTFYRGDDPECTPHRYGPGSAYVDPGGVVHIARNEGAVDLVVIVTRIIPNGAAARIDEPDPGNCHF